MSHVFPEFEAHFEGVCECCGSEEELYQIDGYLAVCRDCLENEMTMCSECGEIYVSDAIEFTLTDDGKLICEYCVEDLVYEAEKEIEEWEKGQ